MGLPYCIVRDPNVDWLLKKIFIPAIDVVRNVGTPTGANYAPASLSVGFSFGSPSYAAIGGGHIGGILLAATSTQVDYLWRIPSEVDKRHPVYFRHHWVPQIGGTTPTISFNQWYQSVTVGTSIQYMSPTQPLNTQIPASSEVGGTDGTLDYRYQITGRGSAAPVATGPAANQLVLDNVEAFHITFQIVSTNFAIKSNPVFWVGMDIEYTPRLTFGDGSRREGRKMESNLGFGEIGATNAY